MPAGNFFSIAESKFGLGNPFPQLNFTFYLFWLIPAMVLLALLLLNKKTSLPAFIAGTLTLSLITIFFLFTKTLIDLGVGNNIFRMLQLPSYIAAVSAIGFILSVLPGIHWLKKTGWLLLGPVLAFSGYKLGEKYIMSETFITTARATTDYTVNALDLIHEFVAGDSTANAKYREKILVINGNTSQAERLSDSTTNIRFDDSTGSYIIFSFDKEQFDKVKGIKPGDPVSLKGSCSGSIFSEILGTTSISFKRSVIN